LLNQQEMISEHARSSYAMRADNAGAGGSLSFHNQEVNETEKREEPAHGDDAYPKEAFLEDMKRDET